MAKAEMNDQFLLKINGALARLRHYFVFLPAKGMRLMGHLTFGLIGKKTIIGPELPIHKAVLWLIETAFLFLDILAVPEIYETAIDWCKWKTRALTKTEIEIARSVFGESIPYGRIRVDESAKIVCRRHHICYVSFFTINSWGEFSPVILIHELMHVWQYQYHGSIYIPRALLAQRTKMGYDYGGTEALLAALASDSGGGAFNFEQQADIVADYFCLREGLCPSWCRPHETNYIPVFEYVIYAHLFEMDRKASESVPPSKDPTKFISTTMKNN